MAKAYRPVGRPKNRKQDEEYDRTQSRRVKDVDSKRKTYVTSSGRSLKKRPPRTVKEKRFVQEYIRTGNRSQAVMNVYNPNSVESASSMGGELMKKLDIGSILESHGLTDDKLVEYLKDGLENANKIHGTDDDFVETPDYAVRHKYLETAFKLKGYWGDRMKLALEQDGQKVRILLDLPVK